MFDSFEKRKQRNSVVQPVLALVVHAGLISLALRGGPSVSIDGTMIPTVPPTIFVLPTAPTGGAPFHGGTGGTRAVSTIDMTPNLPPLSMVTVPISRPGTFDPRRFLTFGTPDSTGGLGMAVVTESDLTDPPQALRVPEPRYPDALRQAGIEGAVTVTYIVDISGFVEPTSIRIVSSDHPAFGEAVVAAVGKAQFTPGRVRGRAVRVLVRQVIRFATRS